MRTWYKIRTSTGGLRGVGKTHMAAIVAQGCVDGTRGCDIYDERINFMNIERLRGSENNLVTVEHHCDVPELKTIRFDRIVEITISAGNK